MTPIRSRVRHGLLAACAVAGVFAACSRQPELDVTAGSAPPPRPASTAAQGSAPPIAPDAELPPGHPPLEGMAAAMPEMQAGHAPSAAPPADAVAAMGLTAAPGGEGDQAIAWTPPAGWVAETPANSVRRAQYRVPGPGGDAECVVFYFGPGQGGDPQSNAQRWASQLVDASGAPATPKTREAKVGGLDVLYVEAAGTYLQGTMTGTAVEQKADYALLAAVVAGPDANWFFKLTGPAATIEGQRAGFETMIGSIRAGGGAGRSAR